MNPSTSSRDLGLDAAKGILISGIVLGHNYFFSRYSSAGIAFLYTFHVASFLLIPFLFRYDRMSGSAYRARLFRILVPQVAFLLATIPLYYEMFFVHRPGGEGEWVDSLPLALLLQTETQLEMVTGFRHFWFLPAMAVTISLLWFFDNARTRASVVLVAVLSIWHLAAGEVDNALFQYFPWSTAIVSFLFVPGIFIRLLNTGFRARFRTIQAGVDLMLFGAWLFLAWVVLHYRFFMPLAGDPYQLVSGLDEPWRLVFQDVFLLVSFFAVLRLGWWLRETVLVRIGRESLKIFLISPLVWQVFWMAGGKHLEAGTAVGRPALVTVTFFGTLVVSYGLARLITATPLQAVVFPKSFADWRKLRLRRV